MKFRVNHRDDDMGGTSLQGYVDGQVGFPRLVEIFGEPLGAGDKTLAEWVVRFEDGTIATIYDWKNYGMRREDVTSWHIGGHDKRAADLINDLIRRPAGGSSDHRPSARGILVF